MNITRIRENSSIYIRLLLKKIKDMKLKKKLVLFLFAITVSTCFLIGGISLRIAGRSIIENSETMAVNLMKQVGLNLDERIQAFEDISYRILQTTVIESMLNYDTAEAKKKQSDSNSAFNTLILQQSSLYTYTRYALLRSGNGVVTEYYRAREKKLGSDREKEILDCLEEKVSLQRPADWILYEGQVYFARKIIMENGQENGILCFAMADQFFSFVGTEQEYLPNANIVIVGDEGTILRNTMQDLTPEKIAAIAGYDDANYYVYTCRTDIRAQKYVTVALNTRLNDWTILGFMPYKVLLRNLNHILMLILFVIAAVLGCGLCITGIILKTITGNVKAIEQGMKNYEAGNFDIRIKPVSYDEIGLLALQLNYMGLQISHLIEQLELKEAAKREADYKTLQAQINPHFLYNTLGSLKWAAYHRGEKETAAAVDSLIHLLRFTIKRSMQIMPLREEMDYIKNYIAIERMRYGDTFQINYEIDETLMDWRVPGFLLQPFLENSFIHGLDMAAPDPCITIRVHVYQKDYLCLEIEDNGIGMSEETKKNIWRDTESAEKKEYSGFNSIGIRIVDARLRNCYGDAYRMELESEEGKGTIVRLLLPEMRGETNEIQDFNCRG